MPVTPWGAIGAVLLTVFLYAPEDEMAVTSIPGLLAHVGFSNPARQLEEAEASVMVTEMRRVLNGALVTIPRDTPVSVDAGTIALAGAISNGISMIRAFTPQLTMQNMS